MRLVDSAYQQMKERLSKDDLDLILQFFMVFSRFERALKRSDFWEVRYKNDEQKRSLEPDWFKFSETVKKDFIRLKSQNQVLTEACDFLYDFNPNKEIDFDSENGMRYGEIPERNCEVYTIIKLIHGVRNNLFHGAKGEHDRFINPTDPQYLKNCLLLLDAFLELHPDVKARFFDGLSTPAIAEMEVR